MIRSKNRASRIDQSSWWIRGTCCFVVVILATLAPAQSAREGSKAPAGNAEVAVLCTLHSLHEEVPGYSYVDLKQAIERLHPDVLAVELTPTDLARRVVQKNKREYQNAVYPLLEQHKWTAIAMEPEGRRREELLADIAEADKSLKRDAPQKLETFDTYVETLFAYLRAKWHSPEDVNATWTDDLFAVKHAFQENLFGPKEREGWEGWNQHFLDRIVETARENPGKRIVVIVGAEHGYWLRLHLRHQPELTLLQTDTLLQDARTAAFPVTPSGDSKGALNSISTENPNDMSRQELTATIKRLDAELFDAYNRCELEKFGAFLPEQLEFYHDQTGGGPMTREQLVAAIKQNICGKVHRELVSIEVYPLKNYGAVETGVHRFTHPGIDNDSGTAKFVQLWKYDNGRWWLTRVISYDHH